MTILELSILSIYEPSTHAYTHVLRLSLDLPYETDVVNCCFFACGNITFHMRDYDDIFG